MKSQTIVRVTIFVVFSFLLIGTVTKMTGFSAQGAVTQSANDIHTDTKNPKLFNHEPKNLEVLSQIGGNTNAIVAQGDYAYIGVGPRLVILDISGGTDPKMVGQSEPLGRVVEGLAIADGKAYVTINYQSLKVFDILNPTALREIGSLANGMYFDDIVVDGNFAYVIGGPTNGLSVINITNPELPEYAGHFGLDVQPLGLAVANNRVYLADGSSGLRIIDVADPESMSELGRLPMAEPATNVNVVGDTAYVVNGYLGLHIVNVTDPSSPTLVGSYDTPGHSTDVEIVGSTAYIADGTNGGLRIVDLSTPEKPTELGFYNLYIGAKEVAVVGDHAYVAQGASGGLHVVDIRSGDNPSQVGAYQVPGRMLEHLTVVDDIAYIAEGWQGGLQLVDLSDPMAPADLKFYEMASASDVVIVNDMAYITSWWHGLKLMNVAAPHNAIELGAYTTPSHDTHSLAVAGHTVYLADGDGGLRIINASDPESLSETGHYTTPGHAEGVVVKDNYAYVATWDQGVRVLDVSEPTAIREVGSHEEVTNTRNIALAGNRVYVAEGEQGFSIFDISTPGTLNKIGSYDTDGSAEDIVVNGDFAYVADTWRGIQILDISDPTEPILVGYSDTYCDAKGIAVVNDRVYIADGEAGLLVMRHVTENGTPTPTPTATEPPVPTNTPTPPPITPTTTPESPNMGDPFESDNTCNEASTISTTSAGQDRTFHRQADVDWVQFDAMEGVLYRIEAQIPQGSPADVNLELHMTCAGNIAALWNETFAPGVRFDFEATSDGPVYLRLANYDDSIAGDHVGYQLSVRPLFNEPQSGAVIIAAGRYRLNDPLQNNIHNVTDTAYALFLANGYTSDDIHYLATDSALLGYDGALSRDSLRNAITQWAVNKVDSTHALTLYIVDHGEEGLLYLDEPRDERISPADLNIWLSELEAQHPGVPINVIIEACHAGSFIQSANSISNENRVIITSTNVAWDAYASRHGAHFSDFFLTSLQQGRNLYTSFWESLNFVELLYPLQEPWIDANGNGIPNELADAAIASQRGFSYAGTLSNDNWPPFIAQAQGPADLTDSNSGAIQVEVRDDQRVEDVWAVIYPPDYLPPSAGNELVPENLDTIVLQAQGNDLYAGNYPGFTQTGTYRIVIHAEDRDGLTARPVVIEVSNNAGQSSEGMLVFLPAVYR